VVLLVEHIAGISLLFITQDAGLDAWFVTRLSRPGVARNLLPAFDRLRTGDGHLFARRGLINNALGVGRAAAWRADAFAANTRAMARERIREM